MKKLIHEKVVLWKNLFHEDVVLSKKLIHENIVLFLTALVAMLGLVALSYLTVLDFCFTMEEQYDTTLNEEVIRELETSIRYGKELDKYYGLSDILNRGKALLRKGSILLILDDDGRVLANSEHENTLTIDKKKFGELRQDIQNPDESSAGTFLTFYPLQGVRNDLLIDVLLSILGSMALCALILKACLLVQSKWDWDSRKLVRVIVCGVLLQGLFLGLMYIPRFHSTTERNVKCIVYYLENTVNTMSDKGIAVDEIPDFKDVLQQKTDAYEWIDSIELKDADSANPPKDTLVVPLHGMRKNLVASFHVSSRYIQQNVTRMFLTFFATIFIAVVFMMESLPLSDLMDFRKSSQFNTRCHEQFERVSKTIRYMSFLSNTFGYLCLSFSALQIKEWNQGCWGLSPAIAAALSISLCTLAEAGGMLFMPMFGIKPRYLSIGTSLLLIVSNLACFATHSTGMILLMRFLAGAASSGHKQVVNTMISKGYDVEEERAANLTGNNAGVIGGILCGMGLGATIAGVFGYGATFLTAGIGAMIYLAFAWNFVPWNLFSESAGDDGAQVGNLLRTLATPSVWKSALLVIVPHYFLLMIIIVWIPGRIQAQAMPSVVLTYSNLLNGIFGLYLGGYVGSFLRKCFGPIRSLALIFVLGAASILLLNLPLLPVVMVLVSASMTGIVDGVGTPLSAELFLGTPALFKIGEASSLMLYSMLGSLVMSASPVLIELCAANIVLAGCACAGLVFVASRLMVSKLGAKSAETVS